MSSHLINSLCHHTIRNHFTQMSHPLLAAGRGHSWISLCELWEPLCAAISTARGALVCIYLSRQPAFTEQSALLTSRYLGPWLSQSSWRAEGVCWGAEVLYYTREVRQTATRAAVAKLPSQGRDKQCLLLFLRSQQQTKALFHRSLILATVKFIGLPYREVICSERLFAGAWVFLPQ